MAQANLPHWPSQEGRPLAKHLGSEQGGSTEPWLPRGAGALTGPSNCRRENSPDGGERAFTGVRWAAPQAEPPLQGGGERSISKLDHRRHQKTPASESVKKLHSIPQVQVTPAQGDEQTWYLPSCTRRLEMPGAGTRGKHQLTLNRKTELAVPPAWTAEPSAVRGSAAGDDGPSPRSWGWPQTKGVGVSGWHSRLPKRQCSPSSLGSQGSSDGCLCAC